MFERHDGHDDTVESLRHGIDRVLSGSDAVVLSSVRCQLLDGFPTCLTFFDVAVFRSPPRWIVTPHGAAVGPADAPRTAINVVQEATLDEDTIRVPNTLALSGVYEYAMYDPTGEILRPSLQAICKNDGDSLRLWPANRGLFFSRSGFCLDTRDRVKVTACVRPRIEEELFVLRRERNQRPGASELDARIAKLERQLEAHRTNGSEG